jgi:diguanylate cyclase (GGDEF)-like protein/PAS domain S-box-containing protein
MQPNNSLSSQLFSKAELELLNRRFAALKNSLTDLYDSLPFGMHTLDANQLFSKINRFGQESLGYEYSELLGKKGLSHLLVSESRKPYARFLENPSRYQYPAGVQLRLISKHGVVLPFRVSQSVVPANTPVSLNYVLYNDTSVGLVDDRLRIAEIAFESLQGIMVTDVDEQILKVNSAFTTITGYSEAEVIGKTPAFLSSGKHDEAFYSEMWRTINAAGKWQGTIWNKRKNGEVYTQFLIITEVRDKKGRLINYVSTMADISEEAASKETIERLAYYDSLTSLPNRRLLMNRLEQALANISRHGFKGAVLFFDIDNFKLVNDTKGHDFGDMLLQQVAERLRGCVRKGDTAARMGGDEFIVLLENLGDDSEQAATMANTVCNKIRRTLSSPFDLDGYSHSITVSIGVAMIEDNSLTVAELLKQADIAMYQAKGAGRNAQRFFDEKMQIAIEEHTLLEVDLRTAVNNNELELFYQLQVDQTTAAIGVEALIRWNHPTRGLLNPDEFIALAEESSLICEVGGWVLNAACKQLQDWADDAVLGKLQVSINISAREFRKKSFVQEVQSILKGFKFRPGALRIELTEGILVEDIELAVKSMKALVEMGVLIELDDFGTGFSSLKYIKDFPISRLKIDQSFVRDLTEVESAIVIVRTVIAMANALGIMVIAEGVETTVQRELLLAEGCTEFQGYLFAKPMPIADFEEFLRNRSE